jgi:transposase
MKLTHFREIKNTKIKLLKRLSYGRLRFEHLAARILLECGFSP